MRLRDVFIGPKLFTFEGSIRKYPDELRVYDVAPLYSHSDLPMREMWRHKAGVSLLARCESVVF